jgi:hypothetical protein
MEPTAGLRRGTRHRRANVAHGTNGPFAAVGVAGRAGRFLFCESAIAERGHQARQRQTPERSWPKKWIEAHVTQSPLRVGDKEWPFRRRFLDDLRTSNISFQCAPARLLSRDATAVPGDPG